MSERYEALADRILEIRRLEWVRRGLSWDQETGLPPSGADERAEQMALLTSLIHARWTDPELLDTIRALDEEDLSDEPATNVARLRRHMERQAKIPPTLARELARTTSRAKTVWARAREEDDFPAFAPVLDRIVGLQRELASALEPDDDLYDALLDEYEPTIRTADLDAIFPPMADRLKELIEKIEGSSPPPRNLPACPTRAQESFGREVLRAIGFDFDSGRLDRSTHPFCTRLGPKDVRLTSRYREKDWRVGFFAVLHEGGHGLYNQGLRADQPGLPLGEPVSFGVHESQSLFWENYIGRSTPFWKWLTPLFRDTFPAYGTWRYDEIHRAVNRVERSLIRVEADEVTYCLHIVLRYELERALLAGDLEAADLPRAWEEKMLHYLGIAPPNDREGVLQDIHWSSGHFGYFPTYALGNLYAAQLHATLAEEVDGWAEAVAVGRFEPVLAWLRERIHRLGQRHYAGGLLEAVTGKPIGAEAFLAYLDEKYTRLYGL